MMKEDLSDTKESLGDKSKFLIDLDEDCVARQKEEVLKDGLYPVAPGERANVASDRYLEHIPK